MTNEYIHLSNEDEGSFNLKTIEVDGDGLGVRFKPQVGLWYSMAGGEDNWATWCSTYVPDRMMNYKSYVRMRIREAPLSSSSVAPPEAATVLKLETSDDLAQFHTLFGAAFLVDWDAVRRAGWAGIYYSDAAWIIDVNFPYWDYWESSSGVVWDTAAIISWEAIKI